MYQPKIKLLAQLVSAACLEPLTETGMVVVLVLMRLELRALPMAQQQEHIKSMCRYWPIENLAMYLRVMEKYTPAQAVLIFTAEAQKFLGNKPRLDVMAQNPELN